VSAPPQVVADGINKFSSAPPQVVADGINKFPSFDLVSYFSG